MSTEDQSNAMCASGFSWIFVGFKSRYDRIFKNINKRETKEKSNKCMEITHRFDIKVKELILIGHPEVPVPVYFF